MKLIQKEVTNHDLFNLITNLDTKIDSVEKNLSAKIEVNTAKIEINTDLIDSLAAITSKGFQDVDKKFEEVDSRLTTLEVGQEDIKLRLNQVAYDFEVKQLDGRVKVLEQKC